MPKTVPDLPSAPRPLGPYSPAVEANGFVFISGQAAVHPEGGDTQDDAAGQTRIIMDNLRGILGDLGLSLDDVVKTTIFLADIGDFAAVNEVYGGSFEGLPPARTTVQAAALPKPEFKVEIEAIAAR